MEQRAAPAVAMPLVVGQHKYCCLSRSCAYCTITQLVAQLLACMHVAPHSCGLVVYGAYSNRSLRILVVDALLKTVPSNDERARWETGVIVGRRQVRLHLTCGDLTNSVRCGLYSQSKGAASPTREPEASGV